MATSPPFFLILCKNCSHFRLLPPPPTFSTIWSLAPPLSNSWEKHCISFQIFLKLHSYEYFIVVRALSSNYAFLKVKCVLHAERNWLMDLFDIDLNKLPNIFSLGKPFQQPLTPAQLCIIREIKTSWKIFWFLYSWWDKHVNYCPDRIYQ